MYIGSIQELHQQLRSKITTINHLSKLTKKKVLNHLSSKIKI